MARKLGVGVGGTVVALGNAADGRLTAVRLKVTGIWRVKGLDAYEWGACYADLAAVQELVDVGPTRPACWCFARRTRGAPSAPDRRLAERASSRAKASPAEAYTWEEMGGPFIGGMLLTRFVARIMDLVMTLIVAAGVMNTALMSVFERTREVGTLRAVGARRSRVLWAVPARRRCCWALGAAAGRGRAGRGPGRVLRPLRHPRLQRGPALLLRRRLPVPDAGLGGASSACPPSWCVVCVLAAFGPAVMAARMRPAESLRYV